MCKFKIKSNVGLLLLLAGATLTLASCGSDEKEESDEPVVYMLPQTRSIDLTQQERTFVAKNNEFALNLFKTIDSQSREKTSGIASPLSLTYVLGMLNDGAAGKTAQEITALLGFGEDANAVNEFCKKMIEGAPQTDPSVELRIANLIAVNSKKNVTLKPQFQTDMDEYYNAETTALDFSSIIQLHTLDNWCNRQTGGMIPTISELIDPNAALALLNATYFKATWTNKFDPKKTVKETFVTEHGSAGRLPTMHQKVEALYRDGENYDVLRLPYGSGDKWSMYVLLPDEGKGISDVLGDTELLKSFRETRMALVDVKIPRFSTKSEYDLIPVLSAMGAKTMFNPVEADFSKMAVNGDKLYVDILVQKAAVEVNEEGTRAAAVTISEVMCGAPLPEEHLMADFHCNRPFVYIIQEASSGAIFFIGTYRGENVR